MKSNSIQNLVVGARSSPLSRTQVLEVLTELHSHYSHINFEGVFIESEGDKDQTISLRTMGKTDFFTKEIDTLLLNGECRIAIHSAKDLPEPLPEGLRLVALTRGCDPGDVLVLREGESLLSLLPGSVIATSSVRREEAVKLLRDDLSFVDIRGTIGQRLAKLDCWEADGVVVAEAALMRLGLTHLNRVRLPGETVPFQGQLAVLARSDDEEMEKLFGCIDTRFSKEITTSKRVLYLGLEPPNQEVLHCPLIAIVPRPKENGAIVQGFTDYKEFTHLIFTSKSAVSIFFAYAPYFGMNLEDIRSKCVVAIGQSTAAKIRAFGVDPSLIADHETAEGVIDLLSNCNLKNTYFFWPHSARARSVILNWFEQKAVRFCAPIFYDTLLQRPLLLPELNECDEIVFTSSSTVDAFLEFYGAIPKDKILTCIGPVTRDYLSQI